MCSKDPTKFYDTTIGNLCYTNYFDAKDGFTIGYAASKNLSTAKKILLLCPGLTGYAIPFIEWFWPLYDDETALVAIDWRGFGLSSGNISSKGYQDSGIFFGFNIFTFASDINELVENYLPIDIPIVFLGHSHGILCAYQYFNDYGTKKASGFINLDESLMNLPQRRATDISYPINSTFDWSTVEDWVNKYQCKTCSGKYPCVQEALYEQFKVPGFAETKKQLNMWMDYTRNINGDVLAFIFKNDMTIDLTYIIKKTIVANNLPVFVYVGKGSLVPYKTQEWIYNTVKNIPFSEKMEVSKKCGGYHTPFLPTAKPRNKLMDRLKKFITNVSLP